MIPFFSFSTSVTSPGVGHFQESGQLSVPLSAPLFFLLRLSEEVHSSPAAAAAAVWEGEAFVHHTVDLKCQAVILTCSNGRVRPSGVCKPSRFVRRVCRAVSRGFLWEGGETAVLLLRAGSENQNDERSCQGTSDEHIVNWNTSEDTGTFSDNVLVSRFMQRLSSSCWRELCWL